MERDIKLLMRLLSQEAWTEEEEQWLRSYLETGESSELYALLQKTFEEDLASGAKISPDISQEMRRRIFSQAGLSQSTADTVGLPERPTPPSQARTRPFVLRLPAWSTAAAVVLLIVSGLVAYRSLWKGTGTNGQGNSPALAYHPAPSTIVPGSEKATLQLGNGAVIQLDSSGKENVISQGSARISAEKGRLSYAEASETADANQTAEANGSGPPAYNILSTPKGGQYQVVLQDGTRVWLNAASSLKYPAVFSGKDRMVELTGEAYFEVAKDAKRAFRVQLRNRLQVEVLGTGFDVMAYPEEGAINTTLVNGSVRLVKDGQSVLLKPGQQGVFGENAAAFKVGEASLEQVLAWKNGIFEFNNLSLQTIMRQVARWYDVDVDYKVDMEGQVYSGTISRQGNISELLKLLEYTGTVHFTIDGKKINVTK